MPFRSFSYVNSILTLVRFIALMCLCVAVVTPRVVSAAVLTNDLEVHLIQDVSTAWRTVPLMNNYSNAIPICNYNLVSFSGANPNYDYPPAAVRIRNITATSFDLRIQGWEDSAAVTGDVHCLISDEGAFTLPNGTRYEAHTVLSDRTSGQFSADGGWNQANLENVSASITQTYTNHVVLGQVISYNDNRASVFHATDCESRANEPFNAGHNDGICVGKHIGQVLGGRSPETIGYLVAEAGRGTVNGVPFELDRGADSVAGNSAANVGYTYGLTGEYTVGVTSQVGEDGGNGSWSVLYGTDPLPANRLILAVDEEIVGGDTSRFHTREIVDYWVFGTVELTLIKAVVNDDGGTAAVSDFRLGASGIDNITGFSGDTAISEATLVAGNYSLVEAGPSGYTGTWSCTDGTLVGNTLTLQIGDEAVCTLTNDDNFIPPPDSFLTLQKNLINDSGGTAVVTDFTLSFDNGSGNAGVGVHGDAAITAVVVLPGDYTLSESGVSGYALLEISCDGLDTNGSDGLTISVGENVTCIFVNDDKGVDLDISKSVSNQSPNVGDVVTFTIEVINNGPDPATNVKIVDVVKAGFSYVAGSIAGGSVRVDSSPAGSGLDWTIASIAVGASEILTFQATVSPP